VAAEITTALIRPERRECSAGHARARADAARAALAPFAELVKSPEHVHTYRLTPLSIWNARATGLTADQMVAALRAHARYTVPRTVEQEIVELAARYGRVVLSREGTSLHCLCADLATAERLAHDHKPPVTSPIASTRHASAWTLACEGYSNRH